MKIEQWHRRQAVMLASQLPEGPDNPGLRERDRRHVPARRYGGALKAPVVTLVRPRPDLSA
jgi:hypothetical protein